MKNPGIHRPERGGEGHRYIGALSRRNLMRRLSHLGALPLALTARRSLSADCVNTQSNPTEGPYYAPEAEERLRTGSGVIVRGVVRDASTCQPLSGVKITRWQANEIGLYEDYYRALITTDTNGAYEFETIIPGIYAGLDRHVHFRLVIPGYAEGTNQIAWRNFAPPDAENKFDFVMLPL